MCFPTTKFECETVTTRNLFEYVHKIINVKINLHHSHITGKIIGYVHDFCNLQVRENKDIVPCIIRNIDGKNLTDLNYAIIDNFKFIDTMKYYQTSLGQLSETLSDREKEKISKSTIQFLVNHDYFSTISRNSTNNQQAERVLFLMKK